MSQQYQHWKVHQDEQVIVHLTLDRQQTSVNTLNDEVLVELNEILDKILLGKLDAQGLIIDSAKPSGFIAGADIEQFKQIQDVNYAFELIRRGQRIFTKLEQLTIPTVAAIHGFCLGGGLELALACDYRIATDDRSTRMGLPEVKLGIHPGWGGSIRLPRLIGPLDAMELMLSGRTLSAGAAGKLGVVDAVVPMRQLQRAAKQFVATSPKKRKPVWWKRVLNILPCRYLLHGVLRRKVMEKAPREHYPAPYAMLENWLRDGSDDEKAYIREANSVAKLSMSETSRNLLRTFHLQEHLKSLGKEHDFSFRHVHVIGAGVMGGDIAAWCALQGMRVTIQDKNPDVLARAVQRAKALFSKKLRKPHLVQRAMDLFIPDVTGDALRRADIIIEAIFEDLAAKQALFKEIETLAKPEALLATNTSTIPLGEISQALKQESRLVGIHFFNPVAQMPLVEVVKGEYTGTIHIQKSMAFVRSIDRLPLPVNSRPGFLVNRVLLPYLMESVQLLEEGIPMVAIDQAARSFGMPMGPIELADTVGLDVCYQAAKILTEHLSGHIPAILEAKVSQGDLGRKSGKGFYQYKKGCLQRPKLPRNYQPSKDLADRMVYRMLNEAAACLREGVVDNVEQLDAGMIFGTGFAPFRGGPMCYARRIGSHTLYQRLNDLASQYGDRFKPDPYWTYSQEATKNLYQENTAREM